MINVSFQDAVAPGQAEQVRKGMQYGATPQGLCFIASLLVPALASLYEHAELDPLSVANRKAN